jgi:hypothetical protein
VYFATIVIFICCFESFAYAPALCLLNFSQVDRWGLVEGGHDVDIADLKVQMFSAVVFLGLSRGM